jgi:pimeloyl-ACP methyl ester carboxylesterase
LIQEIAAFESEEAMETTVRDLIVLIPGILGSVLQYHGQDLWAQTPGAFLRAMLNPTEVWKLHLNHDDPEQDHLGDGITAPRLMPGIYGLHGLGLGAGYTPVDTFMKDYFDLASNTAHSYHTGRYVHFPYDWRRDNRYTARRLKRFVDQHLAELRHTDPGAKVVILAHSMGGLIARYYLDVLEGENWQDCRALITFGTPFRGSVAAIDALSNGIKKLNRDVTPMLRSFTSVYQLLPRYKAVRTGENTYARVTDVHNITGIDRQKALDGLHFHQEIEPDDTVASGLPYPLIPVVGSDQPTLQSVYIENNIIVPSYNPPTGMGLVYSHGDGTVPRVSATPLKLSQQRSETFYAQRHAALQNHAPAWAILARHIAELQDDTLADFRGPDLVAEGAPTISLGIDTLYEAHERIHPIVTLANTTVSQIMVTATADGENTPRCEVSLEFGVKGWEAELPALPPGLYHLEARSIGGSPPAVREIVEVLSQE